MSGAIKHDGGKPQLALLSTVWLWGVARVLDFGAKKYAADNWRKGIAYRRLISAAMRHLTAFADGEDHDPETGLSHLDHASCCLMFLREMTVIRPDLDDRHLLLAGDNDEVVCNPLKQEQWSQKEPAPEPWVQEPVERDATASEDSYAKDRREACGTDGHMWDVGGVKPCIRCGAEPEHHQNHVPETKDELHEGQVIAEQAELPLKTIEEILAEKWQETGVEYCKCCLMPRNECLTRSWMK